MQALRLGFIGAGQMATALARGLVEAGQWRGTDLLAHDPSLAAQTAFTQALPGVHLPGGNELVAQQADVIVLAVKPQHAAEACRSLVGHVGAKLVVSIVAGVTLEQLAQQLMTRRLVRVMPNTPCLIGRGAAAYALGPGAATEDAALVQRVLEAVGLAVKVPENWLDAVTGLSGSGPAFVAMFIEALSDGGVRMGLPRSIALQLAAQTVWGTAEMVLREGRHPAELKDQVASPGGTTIAGIQALEEHGLRSAAMAAVVAATERAQQLAAIRR